MILRRDKPGAVAEARASIRRLNALSATLSDPGTLAAIITLVAVLVALVAALVAVVVAGGAA